jgi:hypothetical protein
MSLQLGFPSCSFKSIFFLIKKKKDGTRVAHLYIVSQMTYTYIPLMETIPGSFLIHDLSPGL